MDLAIIALEYDMEPYKVVQDEAGCEKCQAGSTWTVEDPDGVCIGTSYINKEDAEYMAEMMNGAYTLAVLNPPRPWEWFLEKFRLVCDLEIGLGVALGLSGKC